MSKNAPLSPSLSPSQAHPVLTLNATGEPQPARRRRRQRSVVDADAQRALWTAVLEGDRAAVDALLARRDLAPLNLDARRGTKSLLARALEQAAEKGIVEALLAAGADPDSQAHHLSCLELVIRQDRWDLLPSFLPAGGRPSARTAAVHQIAQKVSLDGLRAVRALGLDWQDTGERQGAARARSSLEVVISSLPHKVKSEKVSAWREAVKEMMGWPLDARYRACAAHALFLRPAVRHVSAQEAVDLLAAAPWWDRNAAAAAVIALSANPDHDGLVDRILAQVPGAALPPDTPTGGYPTTALGQIFYPTNGPVWGVGEDRMRQRATTLIRHGVVLEDVREANHGLTYWLIERAGKHSVRAAKMLADLGMDLLAPLVHKNIDGGNERWDGRSLLEMAAFDEDHGLVKFLLNHEPRAAQRWPMAWTYAIVPPSYYPAVPIPVRDIRPMLEIFLTHGFDFSKTSPSGKTILHFIGMCSNMRMPLADPEGCARMVLERWPAVAGCVDEDGQSGIDALVEHEADPDTMRSRLLNQVLGGLPTRPAVAAKRF